MTYRLVFETTADKRRFVDLAGEEYPSKILDELRAPPRRVAWFSVRGRALGVPEGSLIYLNPRAALWWSLVDRRLTSGMAAARTERCPPCRRPFMLIS